MLKMFKTALCVSMLFFASVCVAEEQLRQRIEGWSAGYPPRINERTIANAASVITFYTDNQYNTLWFKKGRLTESGRSLLSAIDAVAEEGLQARDYHREYLDEEPLRRKELAAVEFDILMTDAFVSLARHLLNGKVNPETLTPEWKAHQRPFNAAALLAQVQAGQNPQAIFESVRTKQPRYLRAKQALQRLREHPQQHWQALALSPAIKPGAVDPRIAEISQRLATWGDLPQGSGSNQYDEALVAAVKSFQGRHGLETDGIIGAETLRALNVTVAQRVADLTVNIERWRWLQEDFGSRFLLVNIAAFDLRVYENGKKVFQRPVIVGREYRKTPVFSDRIRHIVFNPTWTVPHKLAVQDKLPEIKKDPDYLRRLGFTLFDIGTSTPVDPQAIDWNSLPKNRFPYRMVQGPGPQNALGQVKFMFPNAYDVYLHDTPSRDLFGKAERAFSSGCIRVADPLALAQLLLAPKKGWGGDKINSVLDSGKTTTVFLDEPMPVHIEYWTAWVDSSNKLHFRKDIYGRDAPLWRALNEPL